MERIKSKPGQHVRFAFDPLHPRDPRFPLSLRPNEKHGMAATMAD